MLDLAPRTSPPFGLIENPSLNVRIGAQNCCSVLGQATGMHRFAAHPGTTRMP
jgi:hypothetical protein